jgi:protein SCO1/2
MLVAMLAGCGSNDTRKAREPERRFEVRGKVVAVDRTGREVTLAHEEIPSYMEAMTMPFRVAKEEDLAEIFPGDRVRGTLVVTEGRSWLEGLHVAGSDEKGPILLPTDPVPGARVPALALVNQEGTAIRLDQYRGKAVLVTFVFTRCPLPDYCILMSENFKAVQSRLRKTPDLLSKTHLLSISIDPEYDTPSVVKDYGERLMAGDVRFDHWEFATGTPEQVREAAGFFGLSYETDQGQIVHSLRTVVVDPNGAVFDVFRGNEWTVDDAVASLRKALE